MSKIELRPMQAEEAEAVAALARVVWQDTYRGIISQAQIDTMLAQRYSAEWMRAGLASGDVWWEVLLAGGEIVAFACYFLACRPGEMKLDKLYVHPAHQRRGYGARLLGRVEAAARDQGCRTLMLAVNKRNLQAIAAYEKYGFTVREAVVQDIGGGFVMDDYIMEKPLGET
jgi:Acetyltransferases